MSNLFVVTESYYEYNDETYTKGEGGRPIKAFASEEKAIELCRKENLKKLKETNVRDYAYCLSDLFGTKEKKKMLELLNSHNVNDDLWKKTNGDEIFKNLPDEVLEELLTMEYGIFNFFEVFEVENA